MPTKIEEKDDCLYLDNFSAFNYFPVIGHRWRTSTSCNNIGPLWVSQVPKPREEETNGDNLQGEGEELTSTGLHSSMYSLFSFTEGKGFFWNRIKFITKEVLTALLARCG